MRRRVAISLILASLIVSTVCLLYSRRPPTPIDESTSVPGDYTIDKNALESSDYTIIHKDGSQLHRDRISQLLASLKTESLRESVANLTNDSQQYYYPGYYSGKYGAQNELEILLSARRVTKVLQAVPRTDRADAISQFATLFQESLVRYQELIDRNLRSYEEPDGPKNAESVSAATYAISALMLATALSGGSDELVWQLEQIDTFVEATGLRIKKNESLFPDDFWQLARHFLEPDDRFVLNVLILSIMNDDKMSSEQSSVKSMLKDFPQKEVPIVAWDAKTGYYDYVHVVEGIPIDRERIDRTLAIYDWPDGLQLDRGGQKETIGMLREKIARLKKTGN